MSRSVTAKPESDLLDVVEQMTSTGQRIAVRRGRRVMAGIVSVEDLRWLEEMDRQDVEAAKAAEKRATQRGEKPIPWSKAKKMLRL